MRRIARAVPSGSIPPTWSQRRSLQPVHGVRPVMFDGFKREWAQLKRGRPGSRFVEQYDKARKQRKSPAGRVARIIVGLLLFPIGVVFLAIPGPGLLVIALGAVLIAREFRFAARFLDVFEVRGRKVWTWTKRQWKRLVQARRKVVSR